MRCPAMQLGMLVSALDNYAHVYMYRVNVIKKCSEYQICICKRPPCTPWEHCMLYEAGRIVCRQVSSNDVPLSQLHAPCLRYTYLPQICILNFFLLDLFYVHSGSTELS